MVWGTVAGAAAGSVVPGIGTAAGAAVGTLVETFFGNQCVPPCYDRPGGGQYSCGEGRDKQNVADAEAGSMAEGSYLQRLVGYAFPDYYTDRSDMPFPKKDYPNLTLDQQRLNLLWWIGHDTGPGTCPGLAAAGQRAYAQFMTAYRNTGAKQGGEGAGLNPLLIGGLILAMS